jgi:hypothetical protein
MIKTSMVDDKNKKMRIRQFFVSKLHFLKSNKKLT